MCIESARIVVYNIIKEQKYPKGELSMSEITREDKNNLNQMIGLMEVLIEKCLYKFCLFSF